MGNLLTEIQLGPWGYENVFDRLRRKGGYGIADCNNKCFAIAKQQEYGGYGNCGPAITQIGNKWRQEIHQRCVEPVNGEVNFGARKCKFDKQADN